MNTLAFPQLGISLTIKRYFEVFGFRIYWYGIIIAVGFLLAMVYCMRRAARFKIKSNDLIDVALVALPSAIVGCRILYVLCNLDEFRGNFWSVFAIWKGGIAIYGGLALAIVAVVLLCRRKKISFLNVADLAVLGLLIGQIIGRWGNFVNGEAYGVDVENFFLGMSINGGPDVHPIFLYESLWNLIGFVILHLWSRKRRFYGQIFLSYVAWYGVGRGLIEGIRAENVLMMRLFGADLRVSQVIAFVSALVAVGILAYKLLFRDRTDPIFLLSKEEAAAFRAAERTEEARRDQERREKRLRAAGRDLEDLDGEEENGEAEGGATLVDDGGWSYDEADDGEDETDEVPEDEPEDAAEDEGAPADEPDDEPEPEEGSDDEPEEVPEEAPDDEPEPASSRSDKEE